jgi:hypothetical protein
LLAITSVVFMKPLSTVLWYSPIACPISCTPVRKYGSVAVPKRMPFTSPHGSAFGIIQCDDMPAPSRGMLFESPPNASNMIPRDVESSSCTQTSQ